MSTVSEQLRVESGRIAAARAGDTVALEGLYRQFERPVYSLAFRLCQHREDAQEVLQDGFVQALGRLDQYRGESPFWPWLKRIVINQALMHLRRKRVRQFWHRAQPSPASDERPPALALDLDAALAALPGKARMVVWLHDVEGYTHAEIGKLMGKSTSFSKSQLARAHARLRAHLEGGSEAMKCNANLTSL